MSNKKSPQGNVGPSPELSWLTLQAAAERAQVAPRTIRRWIASGDVHAVRLGARLIRVDAASLDALARPLGGAA
jgi:excisionase family DNA binding protein